MASSKKLISMMTDDRKSINHTAVDAPYPSLQGTNRKRGHRL